MDDGSDRASVILTKEGKQGKSKTLVILASLLILLGAGCTKTQQAVAPQATTPTQTSVQQPQASPEATGLCYSSATPLPASFPETGILNTMGHFRPASDEGVFDHEAEDLLPKLKDLYNSGWNIDKFCVTTVNGERVAYFSLYAFAGDALGAKPTKTMADNGEKSATLTRLGYAKGDSIVLSDPIAVGYNAGDKINLLYQLAYPTDAEIIKAKASGFHWNYNVVFNPESNQLDIQKAEND